MWRGYSWRASDSPTMRGVFFAFAAVGLLFVLVRRREKGEIAFWLLIWAGVIASAAFVHFDDGRRVMVVGYPLLWMFLASGLPAASVSASACPREQQAAHLRRDGPGMRRDPVLRNPMACK